jgi:hypothetical protein
VLGATVIEVDAVPVFLTVIGWLVLVVPTF